METIEKSTNFIQEAIEKDLEDRVYNHVQTRFPPEPNGYLHIGHVKAICIDFGMSEQYKGTCNLRLDDTNPTKEDTEYVDAIKEDIEWLVLETKDGKVLVISKFALDCKQYNMTYTDVTWETCSLRKWLNSSFLDAAFSSEEKAMIPMVTVAAEKYPDYYEKINNWNEHFSNLDIEVNTSFKFTSKGTLEQSINKNE